jgi:hypothetical protein
MSPAADTFRTVFDEAFDRCVTTALRAGEWQEEAFDAVTVAMVEVASGIGAGEPEPWSTVEQRSAELSVEAGVTRPSSTFLKERLPRPSDDVRRAAGALADALEDLDLDPGDVFTTPDWAGPLRDDLREAIAASVIGTGPRAAKGRRWWSARG